MSENIKTRFLIICVICSAVAGIVAFQMIRLQSTESAKALLAASENYQGESRVIYPDRGNIYDSKGRLLAGNETSYEVALDLPSISQPETVASIASSVLGLDYAQVLGYAKMNPSETGLYYQVLDNFVSQDKIIELETIKEDYRSRTAKGNEVLPNIDGLVWKAYSQRTYPEGTLASNILGFYNYLDRTGGTGFFGLEEAYNSQLAGTPREVFYVYDPQRLSTVDEVPPGVTLILTLDREIQAMTEKQLDDAIAWSGAEGGTIVVYDPEDGGVISMATTPRLDPNNYWEYGDLFPNPMPYNSAISKTYEPGSVFKVLTMAAALDSGTVERDSRFQDTGSFNIGGTTIYNWNMGGWGDVDMTECMQYSLNVCMSYLATEMGPDIFYSYLKNFGLDRKTGIDLGGESNWPMKLPGDNQWYEVDLATNSFGQGISLTPIQMVMSIGSVANDGRMMAPHLVKAMVIDGQQYDVDPVVVGTPIKAETARTLTDMLVNSLENEASVALVDGYSVAGKTGTGEIATPYGYSSSETNASFVGWGPAEDPKFLVYIWLEKPSISQWGSETAAPVFSEFVSKLVVLMDIPPDNVRMAGSNTTSGQ
ncbi:MAG: penicillin-binding protein 2 [Anaerolineaceae bacterium]|jgi:cell division protein FtsI/penicillin-binding protein 2|nr:penicillin-binding protein 2 [Anaerolineaceae bacterium]MDD4042414.1 penicillin-binding protein 2 [Anaerolineaceae bacterium]